MTISKYKNNPGSYVKSVSSRFYPKWYFRLRKKRGRDTYDISMCLDAD